MKRREFIALIGVSAAWPAVAQAQRQPRLGLLSSSELADWAIKSFRAGLEEGGYVEGRNLTVIYRSAGGQYGAGGRACEEPGLDHFRDRIAGPGARSEGGHVDDTDRLCLWRRSRQ